jgi:hypothetical protein
MAYILTDADGKQQRTRRSLHTFDEAYRAADGLAASRANRTGERATVQVRRADGSITQTFTADPVDPADLRYLAQVERENTAGRRRERREEGW